MPNFEAQDPLVEVNLGIEEEQRVIKVSSFLAKEDKAQLVNLIKQYMNCFIWDNYEVPSLFGKLVKHQLLIKEGFGPHKQPSKRFNPKLYLKIKQEIERLLKVAFIQGTRYVE